MNVPEFHAGQGILLSTKGYIIQWLFNNLRGFFYMMLVFLLVKKKKGKEQAANWLHHLHYVTSILETFFVLIPQVEKLSALPSYGGYF